MSARTILLASAIAAAAGAVACGPSSDHFGIDLSLTQGDEYRCPSPVCTGIPLSCDAVVSVRVVDAADPSIVYVSKCLPIDNATNLCSLGALDLGPSNAVPNRMVRVEVLVWPRVDVPDLVCPTDVQFDGHNMPLSVVPASELAAPAIGGQSYFRAGSGDVATVELGCINITALNGPTCRAPGTVSVAAAVDDFDTGVFLPASIAGSVTVSVGEPKSHTNPDTQQLEWDMSSSDAVNLPPVPVGGPVPAWRDDQVAITFQQAACIQVLEDGPQETPAITCHFANKDARELDLRAFRLAKSTLAQAFNVLRLPGVPDQGLIVGIVVDHDGNPAAGASVVPSSGSVQFLSADRTMLEPGSVTTSSGMFVSRDVPFDATWSASDGHGDGPSETPVIGGLVVGKATVIFIQLEPPSSNP